MSIATRKKTTTLFVLAGLLAVTLVLSACNTMAGIGRDLESAGETINKTATEKRGY